MLSKANILKSITLLYFVIAIIEAVSEYYLYKPAIFVLKPLIPLILLVLYWLESTQRNLIFILAILLSLITNVLFIPNTPICLFYAIIVFTFHRILTLYLIFKFQKIKDFIPLLIATAPFLLIFMYLFTETVDIPQESFYLIIIQNVLISIFAGVALSSYVMNDTKQNSILLISALLFVMLQFVVFIEKYFLTNEYQQLFRLLAMSFNAVAFYTLYKYVITSEKLNNN
ncbi:lysoplasmalogenase family protein [Flavobacterium sp. RSB2_4_14]|uniref:lysoplasmalogenase family protein n=1 Tax=Flavobacterium sp. RSB2_4_14 TaxID=3447665 RepID=UPI003F3F2084